MGNLLAINNLIVSFETPQGELTAVKGVSLSLDRGETLALVGESGCGKTVLCKSILQILCDRGRIRRGEILLEDKNLIPVSETEMRGYRGGDIAMVFQDPMLSLDPAFAVGEQIAEVLRIHQGLSKKRAKARALELMRMVRIPEAEKRYHQRPHQFSGGMRQRIVIAIALAGEPKLLLADEPTTALDEETRKEILILLKEIQRETDVSILFITHDLSLVEDMADRVAIMKDGVIVEEGTVAAVFSAPVHAYTRKLLGYLDYEKDRGHNHRGQQEEVCDAYGEEAFARMHIDGEGTETSPMENLCCRREIFAKPLLSVRNLCKTFAVDKKHGNKVLNDFCMEIYPGEIVGLVGRSGSGKSTLARCIMGIEGFEAGTIEIGRQELNIQMIFQDSQSAFNDRMTVGEIIAEPLRIGRRKGGALRRSSEKEAVAQVMESVELNAGMAGRKPYELSGGQRQRVAIARALITRPDFIIADEPLTGLDVSAQAQIVHLFKKLATEQGLTILFIAHDLPMVNHISHRIIRI